MRSTQQFLLRIIREVPRQKGKQRLSLTLVFKSWPQEARPPAFQQRSPLLWAGLCFLEEKHHRVCGACSWHMAASGVRPPLKLSLIGQGSPTQGRNRSLLLWAEANVAKTSLPFPWPWGPESREHKSHKERGSRQRWGQGSKPVLRLLAQWCKGQEAQWTQKRRDGAQKAICLWKGKARGAVGVWGTTGGDVGEDTDGFCVFYYNLAAGMLCCLTTSAT